MCSYYNSSFFKKKTKAIETTVISQLDYTLCYMQWGFRTLSHGRKKIDVHMIFISFLYSDIPDLA